MLLEKKLMNSSILPSAIGWCQEEFDIFSKSIAQIFLGGIAFWDKFGYCWGGHKDKLNVASNDWLAQGSGKTLTHSLSSI